MSQLAIDLYCGLGGWAEGFLAEGYDVTGFDIKRHDYGAGGYPGQLVLQDVLTLDGSQFKDATVIVASPPCQAYSYMAMPWTRAKKMAEEIRNDHAKIKKLNELFNACFRIQREACEAAGKHIPLIVENVKGAQPWVGRAKWHYGSYYLWGDLPALMPFSLAFKSSGMNWSDREHHGQDFTRIAGQQATKNNGGSWFGVAHNTKSGHSGNPVNDAMKVPIESGRRTDPGNGVRFTSRDCGIGGIKQHGSGPMWFDTGIANLGSRSDSRKAASAMIAKIPYALASHIARCYSPRSQE